MKSCFFIGHREASSDILPALRDAVEQHIVEYGVTEFIVGHYGGFDRLAARAVIDAKAQHPEITLSMLIPYHPAERPVELPYGFDNTFYPPGGRDILRRILLEKFQGIRREFQASPDPHICQCITRIRIQRD